MNVSKLAALALVAVLVTAGAAAAMPGNAPDHSGAADHEQASDHPSVEAADAGDDRADGAGDDEAADASEINDGNATDASDDGTENAATAAGGNAQAAGPAQARSDEARGPPTDLPQRVPDHVAQIHQLILDFLSGDLDGNLGPSISEATPDDATAENTASGG